jgi:hypothetical protein
MIDISNCICYLTKIASIKLLIEKNKFANNKSILLDKILQKFKPDIYLTSLNHRRHSRF